MGKEVMADNPFEAVVAAHHGEIHRYLARVTSRASDADDLSQETFLRAYRAFRALPPGANVRAWLFAIATNLYKNHVRGEVRRRRAMAAASADGAPPEPTWPEGPMLLNETSAQIEQLVAALPLKQRLAFTMRKVHELEYDAIALSLHCSAESARANVFQALRKIRRGMDDLAGAPMESSR
jgi:RNA polymerase sigma-70 factor, ECF subfamily